MSCTTLQAELLIPHAEVVKEVLGLAPSILNQPSPPHVLDDAAMIILHAIAQTEENDE